MRHLIFPLLCFSLSACSFDGKGETAPDSADNTDSGPYDDDDDGYNADVDCDDTDPAVHPDADEYCDGIDSDCDGRSDDKDALDNNRFYADEDGDGHGGDGDTTFACTKPEGYADNDDDCDDDDASVYPGAEEVCGDGVINDCDDDSNPASDRCLEEGEVSLRQADATFFGEEKGDHAGLSVASAGDVDQDGLADLVVGAENVSSSGGAAAGAAYLLLGGRVLSGADGERQVTRADLMYVGEGAADHAGCAVSGAGDINGDGQSDLLIGASGEDSGRTDAGAAYLLLDGGLLDLDLRQRDLSEADIKLIGEAAGDAAGQSLASAGDIDGDDLDDVLIGAPAEGDGGAAYLLLGGGALYDAMGSLSLSTAEIKLTAEATGDGVGRPIAGAGDVDGDGLADIVIGAAGYGEHDAGAAYLLLGGGALSPSGALSVADADLTLLGTTASDNLGVSVARAGDISGDGREDLMIGAVFGDTGGRSSGAVYVLLSGSALASAGGAVDANDADIELYGESEDSYAGSAVASAGDVDGDALDDILVVARSPDYDSSRSGPTYLLLGGGALLGVTGTLDLGVSDHRFTSQRVDDAAGISITGAGDVNGDALDDIVIGASLATATHDAQGAAYLFLSGSF